VDIFATSLTKLAKNARGRGIMTTSQCLNSFGLKQKKMVKHISFRNGVWFIFYTPFGSFFLNFVTISAAYCVCERVSVRVEER
jgi:hypothetical protein